MDDLKILIVGAGIAGLTCAGLLRQRGLNPAIIEKTPAAQFNQSGYMLGLLPLGGRVLTELGLAEAYWDQSIEMKRYEVHREDGELIKGFSLELINRDYGSYRGIERRLLVEVLLGALDPASIRHGVTPEGITPGQDAVEVACSDGTREAYDLVIAADGMHSQVRKLLWDKDEYAYYDTGWGGWVAWLDQRDSDTYREYWGAGSFLGLYPVKGRIGVFLGGPNQVLEKAGRQRFIAETRRAIDPEQEDLARGLAALARDQDPYYWEFHDCRARSWRQGRVILLGDAAAGFLPTAGAGAAMAMDSAAALVDELSRTDREHLAYGLDLYIKRQKDRVESAQEDSRRLGKMVLVESHLLAAARDYALRFYSLERLTKNLSRTMSG